MPADSPILSIDIGGTKVAVGIVAGGRLLAGDRLATQPLDSADVLAGRIAELARNIADRAAIAWPKIAAAGVCCPGLVDGVRGIVHSPANLKGWAPTVPLADLLARALAVPAFVENDANAAALGEQRYGAGRGVANMVYLTISTGIGGGIIINNHLYAGDTGVAGEIGHMTIRYDGRLCNCGRLGCLEAYASGTALAKAARQAASPDLPWVVQSGGLEHITAADVLRGVHAGEPLALRLWADLIDALSAGLGNVINIFNPRRIVLGGGLTHAGPTLFAPLRQQVPQRAVTGQACDIVAAELGDQVGVLGAAAVALDRV